MATGGRPYRPCAITYQLPQHKKAGFLGTWPAAKKPVGLKPYYKPFQVRVCLNSISPHLPATLYAGTFSHNTKIAQDAGSCQPQSKKTFRLSLSLPLALLHGAGSFSSDERKAARKVYNPSCYLQAQSFRSPQTPLKKGGFEDVPPFLRGG